MTSEIIGYLIIDKPANVTSFDCIRNLKRHLPRGTRIGHAGTLDPFATGIMIVGIGRAATKQLQLLTDLPKRYLVTAKLGELTDTLDNTGTVIYANGTTSIQQSQLEKVIEKKVGRSTQLPPIYSAVKFNGRPLYEHARSGTMTNEKLAEVVNAKQREITIQDAQLIRYEPPFFTLRTTVSKGTYIRTLVNDLARDLGSCATAHSLRREACGPFDSTNAISLNNLLSLNHMATQIILPAQMHELVKNYGKTAVDSGIKQH